MLEQKEANPTGPRGKTLLAGELKMRVPDLDFKGERGNYHDNHTLHLLRALPRCVNVCALSTRLLTAEIAIWKRENRQE